MIAFSLLFALQDPEPPPCSGVPVPAVEGTADGTMRASDDPFAHDDGEEWCARFQAPGAGPSPVRARRVPREPTPRLAIRARKVLPVSERIGPVDQGVVLIRDGKIEAVGKGLSIPPDYKILDYPSAFVFPGFVDLHSHIQAGGFGDTNDMVHPDNPEFRVLDAVVPWNEDMQYAVSAGVTTVLTIPGSGTNLSGFGVLLKLKDAESVEDMVLRQPGAMKVAQAWNPERGSGDLGASRMGMSWMLRRLFARALARIAEGEKDPSKPVPPDLAMLLEVFRRKTPVLIHTAGDRDVMATARMFRDEFDVDAIVSHGCFNGMAVAPELARRDLPTNLGPRMYDWTFQADARFYGIVEGFARAGCRKISINTDAGVVPQEDLFLQGAMAARFGADEELCLRGCTIEPARSIGVAERIGSLDPGKDADLVIKAGPPFDARTPVEVVLIDGEIVYDRRRDGQRY
ncbi:MAG TPA: amidohydrolase family protein [Planctomycetota bacterium]|jgi:imidazolonepropionase-like amidohydrolase|nr:amidohydrolase family protein [Planctomycetota bacterium]